LIYRGKGKVKGKEERNETVPTSGAALWVAREIEGVSVQRERERVEG
jgi:hypothetical protein